MLKNLFKSFFVILLCNSFLEVIIADNNNKIEESKNVSDLSDVAQPKLIPLTEEEVKQFRASCTLEENQLLQTFGQELSQCFNDFKSNPVYAELEKMCSDRGFSLQIVLSMIPCKYVHDEVSNN